MKPKTIRNAVLVFFVSGASVACAQEPSGFRCDFAYPNSQTSFKYDYRSSGGKWKVFESSDLSYDATLYAVKQGAFGSGVVFVHGNSKGNVYVTTIADNGAAVHSRQSVYTDGPKVDVLRGHCSLGR